MLNAVEKVNSLVNNFVWGWPGMILLLGVGLYLTVGCRFLQFRKFGYSMKNTIGKVFEKKQASAGSMTPFQAVSTALAATVGTGNVAGVAGAIALGGPGAVFLDVGFRNSGHVHQVRRNCSGGKLPRTQQER